jgi:8-oxo-dGTP pyrophosphatase MutT (NUDIX family)
MISNDILEQADILAEQDNLADQDNLAEQDILADHDNLAEQDNLADQDNLAEQTDNLAEQTDNKIKNKFNLYKKNTWRKKENVYCNNCGKIGHIYKRCYDPITSYGIICIKLNNIDIYDFYYNKYKFPDNSQQLKNICINKYIQKNLSCNNRKDLDIYENKVIKETEYLMVRRKYTFNYIHLIRCIYELNLENIIKSINLLTKKEYENILNLEFKDLWLDIWGPNAFENSSNIDYDKTKEHFIFFKEYVLPQIMHRINIIYDNPEWGFPKGKRNELETNIECAQREFEEETGLMETDYLLLDRLYPLIENIKGSNGINYKYIYYIAILNTNFDINNLKINKNENQQMEIGDIGLFNIDQTTNIIRDYNTDRHNIISNLKLFLTYNTRYFEKFYHENK